MNKLSKIENVAVIGSGIMGSGIAQTVLLGGYKKVFLNDVSDKILKKARKSIELWIQSLNTEDTFNEYINNDGVMKEVMNNTTFSEFRSNVKLVGILAKNISVNK